MLTVQIKSQQKQIPLKKTQIKEIAQKILQIKKIEHANLSVCFVDARLIRKLNSKYLKHDYPTDVLAFDLAEGISCRSAQDTSNSLEGEIVISVTAAFDNAKEFNTTLLEELFLYLIHGILHLSGYDDRTALKRKKMQKEQQRILRLIKKEFIC